jgi:hypothetical protein
MQEFNFPNWVNRLFYVGVAAAVVFGGYFSNMLFFAIHPDGVNVGHKPIQPVPFSHQLHAGELKMDCRYCHNTVEVAGHAAIPPTATCGNCHGGNRVVDGRTLAVVHAESPLLQPVRTSLETAMEKPAGTAPDSVDWVKVHDMPDFVYFNHSAHINRGVSCVSCHGRVDQMLEVQQVKTLSMKFCLDCHRNPEPHLRDPNLVTDLEFQISPEHPQEVDGQRFESQEAYGAYWRKKLGIDPNVSCSTCHR